MIVDITQTTQIGKVYRTGSKPLEVNTLQLIFLVMFITWEHT